MFSASRKALLCTLALTVAFPVQAQEADESALDQFEQTRPVPRNDSPASVELRDAVRRMAQRPTDPVALSDAGFASLKLGDASAALNFFTRANAVQPQNARTLSGMGAALVRTENPFEALKYFDDALKLGASERSIALDRALAFDLLGNFARAHQDYQLAQGFGGSDELTRRYAMSLSMAGKAREADALLVPLLQKNDPEAWRARAFMLAARGEQKEAVQITEGFLAPDAARKMESYLRQMPRMTDAQRAAAMHFGHFPVGRIGEDSAEVKKLASATGAVPTAPSNGGQDRLIPSGNPLGPSTKQAAAERKGNSRKESVKPKVAETRVASANPSPGFSTASAQKKVEEAAKAKPVVLASANLPPPDSARAPVRITLPPAILPAATTPAAQAPVAPAAPAQATLSAAEAVRARQEARDVSSRIENSSVAVPPPSLPNPRPVVESVIAQNTPPVESDVTVQSAKQGPEIEERPIAETPKTNSELTGSGIANSAVDVPIVPKQEDRKIDLGALVQSIEIPESEQKPSVAPVDLKAIEKRQAAASTSATASPKDPKATKAKVEPKVPLHPARIWVQIATGAEAALPADYRRLSRKSPELFKGQSGWTSDWGRTSRLLVGPFADLKTAKKWESDFRKGGGDGFVWQSTAGVEVDKIGAK